MPWISRDSDGTYRLFGLKPLKVFYVDWNGNVTDQYTFSHGGNVSISGKTYRPLANGEPTVLSEVDSPICLEPGELVQVQISAEPLIRSFEGAYI